MNKFLKNIVKLKKISTIKDFRFGTFPTISGSGSGSGYTFYRPPGITWFKKLKFRNFMINIKKKYYIEIEISLLTKSGPHYSSSLNRRDFQICKSPRLGKEKKNNDNIC